MHYYQFNIGDYAKHTQHLTLLENLAYRLLLDRYYLTEKPLDLNLKKLARLVGFSDHHDEVAQILEDFFTRTDDGWVNSRADKEISLYLSKADTARSNGKLGGRPKKPNPNPAITQLVNLANPEETGSKAKHKTLNNNQLNTLSDGSDDIVIDTKNIKQILLCPHKEIFKIWDEVMPKEATRHLLSSWTAKRPEYRYLEGRWNDGFKTEKHNGETFYSDLDTGLDWWRKFFGYCSQSEWLMDKMGKSFNLGWAVKPANFIKIIEGNYHNA